MRLTLGNWHPLLSHGACLLSGLLINSGSGELVPAAQSRFKPAHSYLTVGKVVLSAEEAATAKVGIPIALTKIWERSSALRCRYQPDFALLVQKSPEAVVELASKDLLFWAEFLGAKDKKLFRVVALTQAARLALCSPAAKVSYGSLL